MFISSTDAPILISFLIGWALGPKKRPSFGRNGAQKNGGLSIELLEGELGTELAAVIDDIGRYLPPTRGSGLGAAGV